MGNEEGSCDYASRGKFENICSGLRGVICTRSLAKYISKFVLNIAFYETFSKWNSYITRKDRSVLHLAFFKGSWVVLVKLKPFIKRVIHPVISVQWHANVELLFFIHSVYSLNFAQIYPCLDSFNTYSFYLQFQRNEIWRESRRMDTADLPNTAQSIR